MCQKKIDILYFLLMYVVFCASKEPRILSCPFSRNRIANNDTDLFQIDTAFVGETLQLPCCQKFKTSNNIWFKRNRFFTDEEQNFTDYPMYTFENDWIIANIRERDTGAYYCKEKWSKTTINTFVYLIDVEYPNPPVIRGKIHTYDEYNEKYINPISNYLMNSENFELINLYRKTGLGLRVVIRWERWTECDFCKKEKIRKGRCHIQPYVMRKDLCVGLCELYKFSLHMDCRSNWTIAKIFPILAEKTKLVPNFEAVAKCVGSCQTDIQPGFSYVKKLRLRIINTGNSVIMLCPGYSTQKGCYWRRNGIKLSSNEYDPERKVSVNEFCLLYLTRVTTDESGNYTCYLNDVFIQTNKVFVQEIYWEKNAAWWRHVKYLLYIIVFCFIIFMGGVSMNIVQRKNFKKLKTDEIIEMWSSQRFEHERLLPPDVDAK